MNREAKIIRVFVSSSSDVIAERERLTVVVEELNRSICPKLNVFLRLLKWETNIVPSMGRPQQVISDQIGPYEVFVGIMWKRFGSPTGKVASGTKEEFNEAYEIWKKYGRPRIMFYFNQMPYVLRNIQEAEQLEMVLKFRSELEKYGLICEFTGPDQFERYVREHLTTVVYEISQQDKQTNEVLLLTFDIDIPTEIYLDKYRVLRKLIPHIAQSVDISADEILERVFLREKVGTTGAGYGVALPHIFGTLCSRHVVAIIRSSVGIEWQSIDEESVFVIILVLYAHQRNDATMGILAALSRAVLFFVRKKEGGITTAPISDIVEKIKEELLLIGRKINIVEHKRLPNLVVDNS